MKFEFPSVTYYPHPTNQFDEAAVMKFIEKIGRVCYRSEAAITDESARRFVNMLVQRGHTSVLEHYHFIWTGSDYLARLLSPYKYIEMQRAGKNMWRFSANAVGLTDALIKCRSRKLASKDPIGFRIIKSMMWELKSNLPTLFQKLPNDIDAESNRPGEWHQHYQFLDPVEYASVPMTAKNINWATFMFVTNRGVSHEIVRHRPASYSQESTRYCNYSKDKFGSELTFIVPRFEVGENFLETLRMQEKTYMEMINSGSTPQEARSILPNALATRIVMTAHIDEWEHFLKMRTDLAAHPEMVLVANLVRNIFNEDLILGEPYYVGNPALPTGDPGTREYNPDVSEVKIEICDDPNHLTD